MSEVQVSPRRERDLSRPRWMQSVGNVVMRNLASPIINAPVDFLGPHNFAHIEQNAKWIQKTTGIGEVWARAHALSRNSMHVDMGGSSHKALHSEPLISQFAKFTTLHNMPMAIQEGTMTQKHHPINTAMAISERAKSKGIEGFEVNRLKDIAAMIERPDFQELIHTASFTRQGIWRKFADAPVARYEPIESGPELDFQFNKDGTVELDPKFATFLHKEMKIVNQSGVSVSDDLDKTGMASNGCPARHKKPHFTDEASRDNLPLLSSVFDMTQKELTREHKTTLIQDGLQQTALILKAADHYLQTGEAYKPKRSSSMKKLGRKALEFVRSGWKRI